jgi:hypothetical protein
VRAAWTFASLLIERQPQRCATQVSAWPHAVTVHASSRPPGPSRSANGVSEEEEEEGRRGRNLSAIAGHLRRSKKRLDHHQHWVG